MRKMFVFMSMLLTLLVFCMPLVLSAANGTEPGEVLQHAFASIAGLAAAVLLVTEFVKKQFKFTGFGSQFISWMIAVAFGFVGWWFNWGMFVAELQWHQVLLLSFGAGLVANGIFDLAIVKALLKGIGLRKR